MSVVHRVLNRDQPQPQAGPSRPATRAEADAWAQHQARQRAAEQRLQLESDVLRRQLADLTAQLAASTAEGVALRAAAAREKSVAAQKVAALEGEIRRLKALAPMPAGGNRPRTETTIPKPEPSLLRQAKARKER